MNKSIRSPKRSNSNRSIQWYNYYAGYSSGFVEDTLRTLNLPPTATILDPWNGSGTTIRVAVDLGYRAIGFDLNPVMVIISHARGVSRYLLSGLPDLARRVVMQHSHLRVSVEEDDPLSTWMAPPAIRTLRQIESAVRRYTSPSLCDSRWSKLLQTGKVSPATSFLYVALFRTVRTLLQRFQGSNPTWLKAPSSTNGKICPTKSEILGLFLRSTKQLVGELVTRSPQAPRRGTLTVEVASSDRLLVASNSVSAVITSPPYCTRIDYVMATRAELAVLGFRDGPQIRRLRESMLGTPTVNGTYPPIEKPEWGRTCADFLSQVRRHYSKASATYYLKGFLQYFHGVFESLTELHRVVVDNGRLVIVVQDSYYKDLHLDLPQIYIEMGQSLGWRMDLRQDFPVPTSMSQVNRGSKLYRSTSRATESALFFTKSRVEVR